MTGESPTYSVGTAFLLAAAAAPLPVALLLFALSPVPGVGMFLPVISVGFSVAMIHIILLALPAYLIVRRIWPVTWRNSVLAGALIGGLPSGLLIQSIAVGVATAAAGVCGGLTFWWALRDPPDQDARRLQGTFN